MKANKTTAFTALIISITFLSTGCVTLPEPVTTGQQARQTEQAKQTHHKFQTLHIRFLK